MDFPIKQSFILNLPLVKIKLHLYDLQIIL